jgi:predicted membrane protein
LISHHRKNLRYVRHRTECAVDKRQDELGIFACFVNSRRENIMLYTIAAVLLMLWLLGLVTSYTLGGLIHILLVVAIIVVLLRVISGRKPL